jgi:signal transduction histidine kinase
MRSSRPRLLGAETAVFVVAVAVIAVLLLWWGVFARRLIVEVAALQTQLARDHAPDAIALQNALQDVEQRTHRQMLMIAGEGSTFGVLLLVCVAALFVVARQRRRASERLVKLLQFTTHELKTPIAGVRALLQSLQLGSIPDELRGRMIAQGLLETHRLEHLAETILAFQRVRAQHRLRPVRATAAALVDDVLEHRRDTIGTTDVVRHAAADDACVLVDKDAFRVVLENLLDNARKYGGGKVEVVESTHDGRWRLSLQDQGVGFEPDEAARLFEPFERDAGASTHGSGLGLYISRQLVVDMDGELRASSPGRGRGATFTVELPLASAGAVDASAAAGAAERARRTA